MSIPDIHPDHYSRPSQDIIGEMLDPLSGRVTIVKCSIRVTGDTSTEELERRMEAGFDEYVKTAMLTRELK